MKAKKPFKKRKKRLGFGPRSGHGKTSTRGHKGQKARSGWSFTPGFEGGQNPFIRRLPKRGFNRPFKKRFAIVNLDDLERVEGGEVTPQGLKSSGLIHDFKDGVKILGRGEVKKPLVISAHRFSASAKEKIEKAGGKVLVLTKL